MRWKSCCWGVQPHVAQSSFECGLRGWIRYVLTHACVYENLCRRSPVQLLTGMIIYCVWSIILFPCFLSPPLISHVNPKMARNLWVLVGLSASRCGYRTRVFHPVIYVGTVGPACRVLPVQTWLLPSHLLLRLCVYEYSCLVLGWRKSRFPGIFRAGAECFIVAHMKLSLMTQCSTYLLNI